MSQSTLIGPHGHDYSELASVLKTFAGEKVVFVPNPGNVGDALIDFGGYLIFEKVGLDFEYGRKDQVYPGRVVIYAGGGALIGSYPNSDEFIRNNHAVCKNLVLLPHTVRAYPELLAAMDDRCILFAREAPSFEYLLRHCIGGAKIMLADDLAFFVSREDLIDAPWDMPRLRATGTFWAVLRMWLKFWWLAKRGDGRLNIFRVDVEAPDQPVPALNFDLATYFSVGEMTRADCANALKCLFRVMDSYEEIASNRLHMSVMGAILGKRVFMHDNSYGKNSAIYAKSMTGRFPLVTFG